MGRRLRRANSLQRKKQTGESLKKKDGKREGKREGKRKCFHSKW